MDFMNWVVKFTLLDAKPNLMVLMVMQFWRLEQTKSP